MSRLTAALLLVSVTLVPSSARADPFVVTGGFLVFDYEGDFFRFTGDQFAINLSGNANYGYFIPRTMAPSCSTCTAGDVVNTSFTTPGEVLLGAGSAVIGGSTHTDLTLYGSMAFDVRPYTFPDTDADVFWLVSPFSASGYLRGFRGDMQVFAGAFSGAGLTGQPFVPSNGTYEWEEGRLNFVFSAEPEPVPEPATVLMVGTGLAAAALRTRRRARRSADA